jgi:3-phenylpropionate/trans-cinnamate dioxygenase ferredoxin subunit
VTSVDTPLGRLAVGIANDEPFAVSDSCRHLFASLGGGRVTPGGCLECPWHHSQYDVTTGKMTSGPQGLTFLAVRELFKIYASYIHPLRRYPVVEQNGVIYLDRSSG